MEKYKSSRGWRNCNPLNIRRGEKWQGLRAQQTDRDFCQFLNMTFGYRAAFKVMRSYYRLFAQIGRPWTVVEIIARWAPSNENDTVAYCKAVLMVMGRDPDDITLARPDTIPGRLQLATLVAAMTCVETGCPPSAVPVRNINVGSMLAGCGDPQLPNWWSS